MKTTRTQTKQVLVKETTGKSESVTSKTKHVKTEYFQSDLSKGWGTTQTFAPHSHMKWAIFGILKFSLHSKADGNKTKDINYISLNLDAISFVSFS